MCRLANDMEKRLDEIVVEYTTLALEHIKRYDEPGIEPRLDEIKKRLKELADERDKLLKGDDKN